MKPTRALFWIFGDFFINFYRHRSGGKGALNTCGVTTLLAFRQTHPRRLDKEAQEEALQELDHYD